MSESKLEKKYRLMLEDLKAKGMYYTTMTSTTSADNTIYITQTYTPVTTANYINLTYTVI